MSYDLLVSDSGGVRITTVPFFWLAKLLGGLCAWAGSDYASITRGRHDIIWRSERTGA